MTPSPSTKMGHLEFMKILTKNMHPTQKDSKLVKVVTQRWHSNLDIFAFPDCQHELLHLPFLCGISCHCFPMVEHTLWEGLPTGGCAKCRDKAERFRNGEVSLHLNKWGTFTWVLFKNT